MIVPDYFCPQFFDGFLCYHCSMTKTQGDGEFSGFNEFLCDAKLFPAIFCFHRSARLLLTICKPFSGFHYFGQTRPRLFGPRLSGPYYRIELLRSISIRIYIDKRPLQTILPFFDKLYSYQTDIIDFILHVKHVNN